MLLLFVFLKHALFKKHPFAVAGKRVPSFWLGWMDSNHRNDGVKVRCLTAWRQPIVRDMKRRLSPSVMFGVDNRARTDGLQGHNLAL